MTTSQTSTIGLVSICLVVNNKIFPSQLRVVYIAQWNPSEADTIGTRIFVRYSGVRSSGVYRYSRARMRAHVASV